MKFDWEYLKIKLTSRKLWISVSSFVSLVLFARGMDQGSVEQITSIIMAGGAVIAYIFGEAWVDAYKE